MASAEAVAVVTARSSAFVKGSKKGRKPSVATATAVSSGSGSATAISHATDGGSANSTAVATGEHAFDSKPCMRSGRQHHGMHEGGCTHFTP
jgi:hypothetical protein